MRVLRKMLLLAAGVGLFAAGPASAQFYFKSPDLKGAPVTGAEPGMVGQALPGATPAELRAALVWNLRAALNVAALQCQFAPTLLTLDNYNAILTDHKHELKTSYDTLTKYFVRSAKNAKAGQNALDQYGTRVYSSFSTVQAQLAFCRTAGDIGHDALFRPRGKLADLAEARMRELRASLVPYGEQLFPSSYPYYSRAITFPPFLNNKCWKKNLYQEKKCGPLPPH